MQATTTELQILDKLQEIDLALLQNSKQLTELPQRAEIIKLRAKKTDLMNKLEKVREIKAKAEKKFNLATDEDERLAEKQASAEAAIAEGGAYRDIEAHTKELNGYVKRRNALVGELSGVEEELTKVTKLEHQLTTAIDQIVAAESKAVDSFKKEGGTLQQVISLLEMQKKELVANLSESVKSEYNKSFDRNGSIASAHFNNPKCSVCRSTLDAPHISQIKAQAPLAKCPNCGRLLIVD